MAKPGTADKPRRFPGVLRPIGAVLPPVTRPALRSAGAAIAQLTAEWPAIVGPALAEVTTPRRFAAGTLTLGCTGPVALELQHLAAQLTGRVNAHLGRGLVQRLRFLQEAPRPRPTRPQPARPPPPPVAIADMPGRSAAGRPVPPRRQGRRPGLPPTVLTEPPAPGA